MEQKNALVNCLSLININEQLKEKAERKELIKEVLSTIKTPESMTEGDSYSAIAGVKVLISDLLDSNIEFNLKLVLQKVRVYCSLDQNFYQTVKECLETKYEDQKELKKSHSATVSSLRYYLNISKFRKVLSRASYNINNNPDTNHAEVARELQEELASVTRNVTTVGNPALVASVGSKDRKGLSDVLKNTQKQLNGKSLKTGWQDLDKMLGINKGIVPGELWLMPALPHNCKTLFSLALFVSIGLFNDAKDFLPDGKEDLKPLLLDLTFENELEQNLPVVYKLIREFQEGKPVDIRDVNPDDAANYIMDQLEQRGWSFQMERYTNSDFKVDMLEEIYSGYEEEGYYIVGVRGDYFGTIDKSNLGNGTIGSDVRELYRRVRNASSNKKRKAFVLAPHQLSPKAKELAALEPTKYVRNLVGKGFYDGCTTVDNEADGELYFGKTQVGEDTFLEIQRGKHRTLVDTPVSHRYMVIPFTDLGPLLYDQGRDVKTTLKSINAASIASESDDLFEI